MTSVTGTWVTPEGVPAQGKVILELARPLSNSDPQRVVTSGPVVCDLDETGSISADVVASDDPGWPGGVTVPYVVTVSLDGQRVWRYQVAILGDAVDLTTLTPVCVGEGVAVVPVPGPPGPPSRLVEGTVITGPPGSAADITITGEPPEQVLSMVIPQGMPGEVTAEQLAAAVAGVALVHEGFSPDFSSVMTASAVLSAWAEVPDGLHEWEGTHQTWPARGRTLAIVARTAGDVRIAMWTSSMLQIWHLVTATEVAKWTTVGGPSGAVTTLYAVGLDTTPVPKAGLGFGYLTLPDGTAGQVVTSDARGQGRWADPAVTEADLAGVSDWLARLEGDLSAQQAEIGNPDIIAPHTDLVTWAGELAKRVAALEPSPDPIPPAVALVLDQDATGAPRVQIGAVTNAWTTASLSFAFTPGPGGTTIPSPRMLPDGSPIVTDAGGLMITADGTTVTGAVARPWIRQDYVLTVHRAGNDLIVDGAEAPTPAGSSLRLGDLRDVAAPASTPTGMLLGTTATGAWGPVAGMTRASRPNGTDRLIEVWDGAKWATTHYDSGWRSIGSELRAGWTAATWTVRRVGQLILHDTYNVAAQGGADPLAWVAPIGFRGGRQPGDGQVFLGVTATMQLAGLYVNKYAAGLPNGSYTPIGAGLAYTGLVLPYIVHTGDPIPTSLPGTAVTTAP